MLRVRALPRSFDAWHVRVVGENIFCDEWEPQLAGGSRSDETCDGDADVELTIWMPWKGAKTTLVLCREHAGLLGKQLLEAVDLADGGDILRVRKANE